MNITDLLAEFLQNGKTVTLPGICTLKSEQREAHHDKKKGVFYPAGRTVVCGAEEGSADEIVAAIAERECVNSDVAQQMWRNFIDALSDKLQRSGSHELSGVGTLRSSAQGVDFETAEGFGTAADGHHEQPLENVKEYTPAPDEADPFAIFDKPAMPEPEKPVQPETKPEPVAPVEETKQVPEGVEDALRQLEEMPKSKAELKAEEKAEKERLKAEKAAAKKREEEARAEAKRAEAEAKAEAKRAEAESKAAAKRAEIEAKAAAKAEKAQAKQAKKPKKEPKPKKERKDDKKKRFPWLLILLLLLLLACAGYFGYKYLMANDSAAPADVENREHLDVSHTNDFTYNTDMIEYTPGDVNANRDQICRYLAPYISEYLASRRYTSAKAAMMDRVGNYAQMRLEELLGEKMAVQRFLPYTDYIYEYNYDFLKMVRATRSRVTVQTELMNLSMLGDMLDQLVRELGLEQDGAGFTAQQVAAVKKSEEPKPVITAHFETSSKQGFDIIAGFNVNRDRAVQLAYRLKSQGCDAYIIDKNGLYYVSMGSAPTRTAAEALYKHIKSWYDGDAAIKEW